MATKTDLDDLMSRVAKRCQDDPAFRRTLIEALPQQGEEGAGGELQTWRIVTTVSQRRTFNRDYLVRASSEEEALRLFDEGECEVDPEWEEYEGWDGDEEEEIDSIHVDSE